MFQEADLFGLHQLGCLSSSFCVVLASGGQQYDKRGERKRLEYISPSFFHDRLKLEVGTFLSLRSHSYFSGSNGPFNSALALTAFQKPTYPSLSFFKTTFGLFTFIFPHNSTFIFVNKVVPSLNCPQLRWLCQLFSLGTLKYTKVSSKG